MEVENKKYYAKPNEVITYKGALLLCVKDKVAGPCYFKKTGKKEECLLFACAKSERPDKCGVKFIECKKEGGGK